MDSGPYFFSAVILGFSHTIFSPDHYVPFIALAKANRWSFPKSFLLIVVCGTAHVFSSVLIGWWGLKFLVSLQDLQFIDSFREAILAWALICFGLLYVLRGMKRTWQGRRRSVSSNPVPPAGFLQGFLISIALLGPCEPLIPLMGFSQQLPPFSFAGIVAVFGLTTVFTMLGIVLTTLTVFRWNIVKIRIRDTSSHALAGGAVVLCGLAVCFLAQ
ncbi:MAG: hypothetical protein Q8Q08_06870 [Candidatus Omnitrophota bacterium]|nr:hypothetical protein [Candidatus Omnitrophota bacterium]MDZ4242847.1 hypothetical protein [Candidatus Omnitrophota bacterium]